MLENMFSLPLTSNVWPAVPLCVMWNLWYKRGLEQPTFVIKEHTLLSLYDWLRALVDISSFFFLVEFIDSLSL